MPERTIAEKLKFKPGMRAALLHLPEGIDLGVPDGERTGDPASAAFVIDFATSQTEAEDRLASLAASITGAPVLWLAYPKGSTVAGHDLNRDTVAAAARTVGLVVNANFSIDDTWSAVRMRALKPGE